MTDRDEPLRGVASAAVTTWRDGRVAFVDDRLVDEVPVALVFNGISHAVMLATPVDLEDFARGFAISEGLVDGPREIYGIDVVAVANGVEVRLDVAAAAEHRLKARRRTLAGRTGCGLCGTESLDQVIRPLPPLPTASRQRSIRPDAAGIALQAMAARQPIQRVTGASHAAAWCGPGGDVRTVREDVGRHNALDKLIGAMVRAETDVGDGFVAITSRASVEMIQKAAMVGIGIVVAVSAPTSLAVRLAREHGVALAGFARGADFVAYTDPERFGLDCGTAAA